jgi:hypothetical protein
MKYETLKSYSLFFKISDRAVVVVIVWWLNLQLPMQVEHITKKNIFRKFIFVILSHFIFRKAITYNDKRD